MLSKNGPNADRLGKPLINFYHELKDMLTLSLSYHFEDNCGKVLTRCVENHMHGVLQLRDWGLK